MKGVPYYDLAACDLAEFEELVCQQLDPGCLKFTDELVSNIPVYDMGRLAPALQEMARRRALLAEWAFVLGRSAGVVLLRGACQDLAALDAATDIYTAIIAQEKAVEGGGADHFAAAGANDRVWNAAQKLCLADPDVFARYFGNPVLAAVCEAWLGPGYQMTAQINLVRPGGAAQSAHRDYHLGFQSAQMAARYPAHVHDLSAALTLQGAVAHCDMAVESGPTKLLPFSQAYRPGYLAFHREDFRALFEARCVQVPLARGDAVFFNPALFHAAGANRSKDVQRMANLLQVSHAFGRAMESVDRGAMCAALYPAVQRLLAEGALSADAAAAAIAAAAEGYAFPTNLDSDPPVGGCAPETQADLFARALEEAMTPEWFAAELAVQAVRRRP